jgi:hypothetical protein
MQVICEIGTAAHSKRSAMNIRKAMLLEEAAPMTTKPHIEWYHGSPEKLDTLHSGSTITPILILARAFSHKPEILSIEVNENEDTETRKFKISHDGTKHGYLYRVIVTDPEADLIQHPDSKGAPGEEMLTTHDLHTLNSLRKYR